MTVRRADDGTIWLVDDCPAGDAEMLLQHLLEGLEAPIDWSLCRTAHTAVIQVLLAAGRSPVGAPKGTFLSELIGPALKRFRPASSGFAERQGDAKQPNDANLSSFGQADTDRNDL
jgi:hypothetical protein